MGKEGRSRALPRARQAARAAGEKPDLSVGQQKVGLS